MKLLFGIKSMELRGGGAERVLSIVASGLAERGHDVTVTTFDGPGGSSFYPLHPRVRRLPLASGPTDRKSDARSFLARVGALRRAVERERPDVAVGFMHSAFVPMAFANVGTGIPFVASEHIVREYYASRRAEFALLVWACRQARCVTVLSETIRRAYPAAVRSRMVVMPNPVPAWAATSAAARDAGSARVVLNVGRLEAQKDQATLIDAFGIIADRHPEWSLRIVGDGSLRVALEERVRAAGLSARARLVATTDRIEDEYARAHVFAMSSRFESFGVATAEAMSTGLPVVGFADCPGTNELVRNGENGLLVDVVDGDRARAFAQGLATLMNDDARRRELGERARHSVEEFHPERIVARWERLLTDVATR